MVSRCSLLLEDFHVWYLALARVVAVVAAAVVVVDAELQRVVARAPLLARPVLAHLVDAIAGGDLLLNLLDERLDVTDGVQSRDVRHRRLLAGLEGSDLEGHAHGGVAPDAVALAQLLVVVALAH